MHRVECLHVVVVPSTKLKLSLVDLMLVAMSFIWGLNFIAVKLALTYFTPLIFNAVRFGIASLILLGFLWLKEVSLKVRGGLKKVFASRHSGNTLYQILFINGIFAQLLEIPP
ncbi:MAG: EamA family transporter [Candidatus Bathyarchaeia archaeon]